MQRSVLDENTAKFGAGIHSVILTGKLQPKKVKIIDWAILGDNSTQERSLLPQGASQEILLDWGFLRTLTTLGHLPFLPVWGLLLLLPPLPSSLFIFLLFFDFLLALLLQGFSSPCPQNPSHRTLTHPSLHHEVCRVARLGSKPCGCQWHVDLWVH